MTASGSGNRIPLQSCAAAGAVQACSSVTDAVTLIHGPVSCAHIMSSAKDLLDAKRIPGHMPVQPQSRRIRSTRMDDDAAIFGGADALESALRTILGEGTRRIYVVTACMPGIIGDDAGAVIRRVLKDCPDAEIDLIDADGNMTGDFDAGFVNATRTMLKHAEDGVETVPGRVNLIAERYFFKTGKLDDGAAIGVLEEFGLDVRCRFLYRSDSESIRDMRSSEFSLMANDDPVSLTLSRCMKDAGFDILDAPLPTSLSEYRTFADRLTGKTGRDYSAVVDRAEASYRDCVSLCSRRLSGRRVIVMARFTHGMDWLLELLSDLGMDLIRLGIGQINGWRPASVPQDGVMATCYEFADLLRDVEEMGPDMVMLDSDLVQLNGIRVLKIGRPMPGMAWLTDFAGRICDAFIAPVTEGWRSDA